MKYLKDLKKVCRDEEKGEFEWIKWISFVSIKEWTEHYIYEKNLECIQVFDNEFFSKERIKNQRVLNSYFA